MKPFFPPSHHPTLYVPPSLSLFPLPPSLILFLSASLPFFLPPSTFLSMLQGCLFPLILCHLRDLEECQDPLDQWDYVVWETLEQR